MRRSLKADYRSGHPGNDSSLHGRTLMLARMFDDVVFAYQPRRNNGAAHCLARSVSEPREP